MKDFLIKQISDYLVSVGYSISVSASCAYSGWEFFDKSVCNSKDAFKDACDHAGLKAQIMQPSVKYKSPKSKTTRRAKRPQEAFKF